MKDAELKKCVSLIEFPNYLINKNGHIYSLYRNKYLKETDNGKGYYRYTLTNRNGELIRHDGQIFIALAWLPNPENKPTVDHVNRNRKDNRVENLRWATLEEQSFNKLSSYSQAKRTVYYEICNAYSKRYEKGRLINDKSSVYRCCIGERATEMGKIYSFNPPCLSKPYKIALSSGPCAGKTSLLPFLKKRLEEYHYNVVIVPEAATELLSEGIKPDENFQYKIAERQLHNEEIASSKAELLTDKTYNETIILYDRSFICNQAYCTKEEFEKIKKKLSISDIYDRYDACIHLETGAFYNYETEGRFETREEAIELDKKTLLYTSKHKNFVFIKAQKNISPKQSSLFSNTMKLINKIRSFERWERE